MHPQLDRNRFQPCEILMDALEECHRQQFLTQALGLCNFEKIELTKCLNYTRLEHAKEKFRESREKNKKFEALRKKNEEEVYGKNGYLKKMIEKEAEKAKTDST